MPDNGGFIDGNGHYVPTDDEIEAIYDEDDDDDDDDDD